MTTAPRHLGLLTALMLGLCLGLGAWRPTVASAAPAPESSAPARVQWEAPLGCPDAGAFQAEVERNLGGASLESYRASVDGSVAIGDVGYVLRLTIDVDGTVESRRVESDDCVLLFHTAALLVAITVDAVATADALGELALQPEPEPEPEPEPASIAAAPPKAVESPAQPEPAVPVADESEPPAPRRDPARLQWRHGVEGGLGGGLGVALVPGVTGGLEGNVGWRYGPVRLRAIGYHWFGRSESVDEASGIFAAQSGGGLRGCYALAAARVDVPMCLGPDLAAMHGRGIGTAVVERSPVDLWVAAAVSVGLEIPVSPRFMVQGRLELVATLRRPAFHLDRPEGPVEVFRAPPVGFRLVLGASVRSQ